MTLTATDPTTELLRLVEEHQTALWRYLRFLGASHAEAEDLVQETFIRVWQRPFEIRSPESSLAYLRKVARSRLLMLLRTRGRRPAVANLEEAERIWLEFATGDGGDRRIDALEACVEALSQRSRRAVQLTYGEQLDATEIAAQLELKPEGLRTLLRRVRESLKECVERRLSE